MRDHFLRAASAVTPRALFVGAALVAVAAIATGCDPKADKDACTKMVDHDYGILDERNHITSSDQGKKMFEELKAKSLEGCLSSMTKSQVECHMKAPTPADMSKCDGK